VAYLRTGSVPSLNRRSLGAEGDDYIAVLVRQKQEAFRLFGATDIGEPGRPTLKYANVSGTYAAAVKNYWVNEAFRVRSVFKVDSAHLAQWERAVSTLSSSFGQVSQFLMVANATSAKRPVPKQFWSGVKLFWDSVDAVAIPMNAIEMTPTTFEIAAGAVLDALNDARKAAENSISGLIKTGLLFGGGFLALSILANRR
jgi:hypothetical protein